VVAAKLSFGNVNVGFQLLARTLVHEKRTLKCARCAPGWGPTRMRLGW